MTSADMQPGAPARRCRGAPGSARRRPAAAAWARTPCPRCPASRCARSLAPACTPAQALQRCLSMQLKPHVCSTGGHSVGVAAGSKGATAPQWAQRLSLALARCCPPKIRLAGLDVHLSHTAGSDSRPSSAHLKSGCASVLSSRMRRLAASSAVSRGSGCCRGLAWAPILTTVRSRGSSVAFTAHSGTSTRSVRGTPAATAWPGPCAHRHPCCSA